MILTVCRYYKLRKECWQYKECWECRECIVILTVWRYYELI